MCACSFPCTSPIKWSFKPLKFKLKSTRLIVKFICQPKLIPCSHGWREYIEWAHNQLPWIVQYFGGKPSPTSWRVQHFELKAQRKRYCHFPKWWKWSSRSTIDWKWEKIEGALGSNGATISKVLMEGWCHELPFSFSLPISKSSTKIQDAKLGQVWWDRLP